MRGCILAGGHATRLRPCTLVTGKHLLPVYDKPMIFYPIFTLKEMGILDILIILGSSSPGDAINLLGDGSQFELNFTYRYQREAGGIAQAVGLAEDFASDRDIVIILGDNVFLRTPKPERAPHIYLTKVDKPERFGVVKFQGNKIVEIIEKPRVPSSNLIVTGLYIYPPSVFEIIKGLKPSKRGELEITEVNNFYIKLGEMTYTILEDWFDCGQFESLWQASKAIYEKRFTELERKEKKCKKKSLRK